MKWLSPKLLLVISLVWWLGVGWAVVDYNLGLGTTTLRWRNPAHTTAAWTWDAAEPTPTVIEPKSGQWLRVTLPRGFSTGTLRVETKDSADLILRGEGSGAAGDVIQASQGATHELSFSWKSLVARGRTFRFRVENPTTVPVNLRSLELQVSR